MEENERVDSDRDGSSLEDDEESDESEGSWDDSSDDDDDNYDIERANSNYYEKAQDSEDGSDSESSSAEEVIEEDESSSSGTESEAGSAAQNVESTHKQRLDESHDEPWEWERGSEGSDDDMFLEGSENTHDDDKGDDINTKPLKQAPDDDSSEENSQTPDAVGEREQHSFDHSKQYESDESESSSSSSSRASNHKLDFRRNTVDATHDVDVDKDEVDNREDSHSSTGEKPNFFQNDEDWGNNSAHSDGDSGREGNNETIDDQQSVSSFRSGESSMEANEKGSRRIDHINIRETHDENDDFGGHEDRDTQQHNEITRESEDSRHSDSAWHTSGTHRSEENNLVATNVRSQVEVVQQIPGISDSYSSDFTDDVEVKPAEQHKQNVELESSHLRPTDDIHNSHETYSYHSEEGDPHAAETIQDKVRLVEETEEEGAFSDVGNSLNVNEDKLVADVKGGLLQKDQHVEDIGWRELNKKPDEHVQVFVQLRPSSFEEASVFDVSDDRKTISMYDDSWKGFFDGVHVIHEDDRSDVSASSEDNAFSDSVMEGLAEQVVGGGQDVLLAAFGHGDSGKTNALFDDGEGLAQQLVDQIFGILADQAIEEVVVRVSVVEVFLERITDLLLLGNRNMKDNLVYLDERGDLHGCSQLSCLCPDDVFSILQRGLAYRTSRRDDATKNSLRSTVLFQLTVERRDTSNKRDPWVRSSLRVAELASLDSQSPGLRVLISKVKEGMSSSTGDDEDSPVLVRLFEPSFLRGHAIARIFLDATPSEAQQEQTRSILEFGLACRAYSARPFIEKQSSDYSPNEENDRAFSFEAKELKYQALIRALAFECIRMKNESTVSVSKGRNLWSAIHEIERSADEERPLNFTVETYKEHEVRSERIQTADRIRKLERDNDKMLQEKRSAQAQLQALKVQSQDLAELLEQRERELEEAKAQAQEWQQKFLQQRQTLKVAQFRESESVVFVRQFRRFYARLLKQMASAGSAGNVLGILQEIPGVLASSNDLIDLDKAMIESGLLEPDEGGCASDDTDIHSYSPSATALKKSEEHANQLTIAQCNSMGEDTLEDEDVDIIPIDADIPVSQSVLHRAETGRMTEARQKAFQTPSGLYIKLREDLMEEGMKRLSDRCVQLKTQIAELKAREDEEVEEEARPSPQKNRSFRDLMGSLQGSSHAIKSDSGRAVDSKEKDVETSRLKAQLEKKRNDLQAVVWKMNEILIVSRELQTKVEDRERVISSLESNLSDIQEENRELQNDTQAAARQYQERLISLERRLENQAVTGWHMFHDDEGDEIPPLKSRLIVPFSANNLREDLPEPKDVTRRQSNGESERFGKDWSNLLNVTEKKEVLVVDCQVQTLADSLQSNVEEVEMKLEVAQKEINALNAELAQQTSMKEQLEVSLGELATLQSQLSQTEADLAIQKSLQASEKQEVDSLKTKLSTANGQLSQLESMRQELELSQKETSSLQIELRKAQAQMKQNAQSPNNPGTSSDQQQVEALKAQLTAAKAQLTHLESLKKKLESSQKQVETLETELRAAQSQISTKPSQLEDTTSGNLKRGFESHTPGTQKLEKLSAERSRGNEQKQKGEHLSSTNGEKRVVSEVFPKPSQTRKKFDKASAAQPEQKDNGGKGGESASSTNAADAASESFPKPSQARKKFESVSAVPPAPPSKISSASPYLPQARRPSLPSDIQLDGSWRSSSPASKSHSSEPHVAGSPQRTRSASMLLGNLPPKSIVLDTENAGEMDAEDEFKQKFQTIGSRNIGENVIEAAGNAEAKDYTRTKFGEALKHNAEAPEKAVPALEGGEVVTSTFGSRSAQQKSTENYTHKTKGKINTNKNPSRASTLRNNSSGSGRSLVSTKSNESKGASRQNEAGQPPQLRRNNSSSSRNPVNRTSSRGRGENSGRAPLERTNSVNSRDSGGEELQKKIQSIGQRNLEADVIEASGHAAAKDYTRTTFGESLKHNADVPEKSVPTIGEGEVVTSTFGKRPKQNKGADATSSTAQPLIPQALRGATRKEEEESFDPSFLKSKFAAKAADSKPLVPSTNSYSAYSSSGKKWNHKMKNDDDSDSCAAEFLKGASAPANNNHNPNTTGPFPGAVSISSVPKKPVTTTEKDDSDSSDSSAAEFLKGAASPVSDMEKQGPGSHTESGVESHGDDSTEIDISLHIQKRLSKESSSTTKHQTAVKRAEAEDHSDSSDSTDSSSSAAAPSKGSSKKSVDTRKEVPKGEEQNVTPLSTGVSSQIQSKLIKKDSSSKLVDSTVAKPRDSNTVKAGSKGKLHRDKATAGDGKVSRHEKEAAPSQRGNSSSPTPAMKKTLESSNGSIRSLSKGKGSSYVKKDGKLGKPKEREKLSKEPSDAKLRPSFTIVNGRLFKDDGHLKKKKKKKKKPEV